MNLFAMLLQMLLLLLGKSPVGSQDASLLAQLIALVQRAEAVGADFISVWRAVVSHSLADAITAVTKLLTDLGVQGL